MSTSSSTGATHGSGGTSTDLSSILLSKSNFTYNQDKYSNASVNTSSASPQHEYRLERIASYLVHTTSELPQFDGVDPADNIRARESRMQSYLERFDEFMDVSDLEKPVFVPPKQPANAQKE
ncbi:hypothetical protein VTL71DRAFT_14735 [Oculimacula yallundae]|uniref:Uncharacterized protein n=1 Tax=Oculimacula yallundae TaxID=86028 RepID=A0ABR4CJB4_9HELO